MYVASCRYIHSKLVAYGGSTRARLNLPLWEQTRSKRWSRLESEDCIRKLSMSQLNWTPPALWHNIIWFKWPKVKKDIKIVSVDRRTPPQSRKNLIVRILFFISCQQTQSSFPGLQWNRIKRNPTPSWTKVRRPKNSQLHFLPPSSSLLVGWLVGLVGWTWTWSDCVH